ncbi:ABC transporter permease [Dehalococcoidia bacterium]|nr:ABC transporter permease [Dehalococcoidia bacterium]
MNAYIIRRLLLIIPTMFILTLLVFLSIRFIPGNIVDLMLMENQLGGGPRNLDRAAMEARLGLDVPVHVQYVNWMRGIFLHGTLGESLRLGWTVEDRIASRLPATIQLGVMAIVIGLLIALPIGIYSAIRQDTAVDYLGRSVAVLGMATPNFWLAIMVMTYPAIWWGWSPPMEMVPFTEDPLANLWGFFIPSLILGTAGAAGTMRLTRTALLEVLRQDYIRTARSKGLRERVVVLRHAIKNAFIPIVTLVGMQIPLIVTGAVIIENIFALPGVGQLFIIALDSRDYPVVQGVNLFLSTVVMFIILVTDLIYPYLDPRVRYQ